MAWEQGNQNLAREWMIEAQAQAPRSSILAFNLAHYYTKLDESDDAQIQIDQAFFLNPWLWFSPEYAWKPQGGPLESQRLQEFQKTLSSASFNAWKGWMLITTSQYEQAQETLQTSLQLDPSRIEALAGLAFLALAEGDEVGARHFIGIADLSGKNSWILEFVKGELEASVGQLEKAYAHWVAATRLWIWTTSSAPYYESVYSRAYIPIDLPPQIIQPPIPKPLLSGFRLALDHGSENLRADAQKLLPWIDAALVVEDK
jgi:tetratricopeptide (TPR) repeat protein